MDAKHDYVGLWEGILAEINEQLSQDPDDNLALSKKIHALANLKRFDEALQLCDSLLKKEYNATNLLCKARVYKQMNQVDTCIEICNEALRIEPENASVNAFLNEQLKPIKPYAEAKSRDFKFSTLILKIISIAILVICVWMFAYKL